LFSTLSSVFLTSGEAAGLAGVAPGLTGDGDGVGLAAGLAAGDGDGDAATGGLVIVLFAGVPEQAPRTATLAAKTVDIMINLLIVFLLLSVA
jgi:hypothetical protein